MSRLPLFVIVLIMLATSLTCIAIQSTHALVLYGLHCPPEFEVVQATQMSKCWAMFVTSSPGLADMNSVTVTVWLSTANLQLPGGYIQGRPIPGRTITFVAKREDGSIHATQDVVTDLHGQASFQFDNLPVTGSINHAHCAQTPSATWECYDFYAYFNGGIFGGVQGSQQFGNCIVEASCESEHSYVLLEDSEVPIVCLIWDGCLDWYGGIYSQLNLTLTFPTMVVDVPTQVEVDQPPPPPPMGIPAGAAIVDFRYVYASGPLYNPATAALNFSSSTLYGYGQLGTEVYHYQNIGREGDRAIWMPVSDWERTPLGNQIRWPLEEEGFYALVAYVDTDHDGIEDILEIDPYGTLPNNPDTDGDLLTDGHEVMVSLTLPTDPDTDGDIFFDSEEITLGTNPNDPRDYPYAVDRGDHTAGNIQTTMTDKGIFGYLAPDTPDGLGFIYPAGGANCLYIGGLWAGTGPDYVVNRDYAGDTIDWEVAAEPDGHIVIDAPPEMDQRIRSSYNDSPHPQTKWLRAYQETAAWSAAEDNSYILEHILIVNEGTQPIEGLYVGQFMDFDIPSATTSNRGTADLTRNLLYMWESAPTPYVGMMLIAPQTPANVSFVHNPTYVWPSTYVLDADKWAFLSAADPAHIVHDAPAATDWSMLVSAGPFDLDLEESATIGLALVAGASPAELIANADRARAQYYLIYGGSAVDEGPLPAFAGLKLRVLPNPFAGETEFRYFLPETGTATLAVYDVAGRVVRILHARTSNGAGEQAVRWDGCDMRGLRVAPGVYLYRLDAGTQHGNGRLMLVR